MNTLEQADRDANHRDVEHADDADDGGVARGRVVVAAERAQHQIADVDRPQDDGHGEARIPRPPDAPDRARPDRAGDEDQRAEQDAHLGRGVGQTVGGRGGPPQVDRARAGDDEEAEERGPRDRDVEIEDALHDPHLRLGRYDDEDHPLRQGDGDERGPGQQRVQPAHQSRITCSNSRMPATRKMASNAARTPSGAAAAPRPPRSAASVAFTPPMSTGTRRGRSSRGSITSRARARTVMAANSVASAANPMLPRKSTSNNAGSTPPTSACSSTATSGTAR